VRCIHELYYIHSMYDLIDFATKHRMKIEVGCICMPVLMMNGNN
jgi:hypothetical protein